MTLALAEYIILDFHVAEVQAKHPSLSAFLPVNAFSSHLWFWSDLLNLYHIVQLFILDKIQSMSVQYPVSINAHQCSLVLTSAHHYSLVLIGEHQFLALHITNQHYNSLSHSISLLLNCWHYGTT
jgi:hypothetical protein